MSKYGDKNMRKDYTASRRYILTTPVKNEEKNLPKLIESIVKQTVRPLLWAIVDDGSIDKSPKIIKEAKDKYNWIQSIWLNDTIRDRGLHLATVMKKGFDFAIEYCKKNGIVFDYLGNVDADAILEDSSFKNLIKKFESNPKLGIGSCGDWLIKGDQMKYIKERLPAGGNVLYRKKCFDDCGGISISYAWDSVLNTKAILRGWEIKRFDDSRAFYVRGVSTFDGLWNGYKEDGESSYFVNYNFFYAIAKGLKLLFKKPYYIGLSYLYGYLGSLMLRKEQINDEEIKYYYQHIRPKEINRYYFDMLKNEFLKK